MITNSNHGAKALNRAAKMPTDETLTASDGTRYRIRVWNPKIRTGRDEPFEIVATLEHMSEVYKDKAK